MLCCRIAAGGLALLAASVVNTSAQSCLPWACQESRSSARATDASSTQNARNNLPSSRRDQRKLSAAQSQQRVARRELMSANGMVRPCSCPPASEACQGRQSQGARYVSATTSGYERFWETVPRTAHARAIKWMLPSSRVGRLARMRSRNTVRPSSESDIALYWAGARLVPGSL